LKEAVSFAFIVTPRDVVVTSAAVGYVRQVPPPLGLGLGLGLPGTAGFEAPPEHAMVADAETHATATSFAQMLRPAFRGVGITILSSFKSVGGVKTAHHALRKTG
jgi:hypothetical protein